MSRARHGVSRARLQDHARKVERIEVDSHQRERAAQIIFVYVPNDHDEPCAVVIRGPGIQDNGGMEDVLNPMHHNRGIHILQIDDAFNPKKILSLEHAEDVEPALESVRFQGLFEGQANGPDTIIVTIYIMVMVPVMMMVSMIKAFSSEPALHVMGLSRGIVESRIQEEAEIGLSIDRSDDWRRRIEGLQAVAQRFGRGGRRHIRLGEYDAIRDGGLFERFLLRVQRRRAHHGVDRRDDAIQAIERIEMFVSHERVKDRCGVREASRLDHDAIEPTCPVLNKTPGGIAERCGQIPPDRAA